MPRVYVHNPYSFASARFYFTVLKLVERKGNQDEKHLNVEISNLIGRRTCMHDFDTMGAEVCVESGTLKVQGNVCVNTGPRLPQRCPSCVRAGSH